MRTNTLDPSSRQLHQVAYYYYYCFSLPEVSRTLRWPKNGLKLLGKITVLECWNLFLRPIFIMLILDIFIIINIIHRKGSVLSPKGPTAYLPWFATVTIYSPRVSSIAQKPSSPCRHYRIMAQDKSGSAAAHRGGLIIRRI